MDMGSPGRPCTLRKPRLALLMEEIVVKRFKPYRKMRWYRSNYLWSAMQNQYLAKYRIKVVHGMADPQDVLAIPCPHVPGHEAMIHRDDTLWIQHGHRGLTEYQDTPMICDSSIDYAYLDPPMRDLLSHPQVRAYMTGVSFRDGTVQQRRCWGGEYYGMVYKERELHNRGPDIREEREPFSQTLRDKLVPLDRPPTPPFSDEVFEYIKHNIKPLKDRPIDLFFSGRTTYLPRRFQSHPTAHRKHLEDIWSTLPGKNNILKVYDDFAGTKKNGRPVKVYQYPYEYVDALMRTKVVISPWGWSPWCVRDLEALACGCIVIKPECSNMLIYPDIYDAKKQFMVWGDIMYEHLPDQLNYCYTRLDEMQHRVDRGREFVFDALYPNAKIHARWTHSLRKILENALERPAYALADRIPNDYDGNR